MSETQTVYLRGGSLQNLRKRLVPVDAQEVYYEEAPGEVYVRTSEYRAGEPVFEYSEELSNG